MTTSQLVKEKAILDVLEGFHIQAERRYKKQKENLNKIIDFVECELDSETHPWTVVAGGNENTIVVKLKNTRYKDEIHLYIRDDISGEIHFKFPRKECVSFVGINYLFTIIESDKLMYEFKYGELKK